MVETSASHRSLWMSQPRNIDRGALEAALANDKVMGKLKTVTDNAIAAGVFGSPFFIVDGEAFWGNDRIGQIDEWLTRGGW